MYTLLPNGRRHLQLATSILLYFAFYADAPALLREFPSTIASCFALFNLLFYIGERHKVQGALVVPALAVHLLVALALPINLIFDFIPHDWHPFWGILLIAGIFGTELLLQPRQEDSTPPVYLPIIFRPYYYRWGWLAFVLVAISFYMKLNMLWAAAFINVTVALFCGYALYYTKQNHILSGTRQYVLMGIYVAGILAGPLAYLLGGLPTVPHFLDNLLFLSIPILLEYADRWVEEHYEPLKA